MPTAPGEGIGPRLFQLRKMYRSERHDRTASPEEICEDSKLSGSTLRDYESGISIPGGLAIVQLCYLYDATADWILGIPPVRQR